MTLTALVQDGLWSPRYRALTAGLVMTMSLTAFEVLAVATIMPIVAGELGGLELYGWAFSAFFLGSLLGTVVVGGLVDGRGLVGAFVGSLVLFGIGLVMAGAAPAMPVLVGGRFIQGLGGGALLPVINVAIGRGYPEMLRARMFATLSTAWVIPAMVGPAAAGLLAQSVDWRIVFLGLVPLILVAGVLTFAALETLRPSVPTPGPAESGAGASVTGWLPDRYRWAVQVTLGAMLLTAGFSNVDTIAIGWFTLPFGVADGGLVIVGAILVLAAFRRLTPPGTLRLVRGMPSAIFLRGLLTFAFYPLDAYASLALIDWRGIPAPVAGLALAAGSLAWTAGSWTQARVADRHDGATQVRVGFGLVAVGMVVFLGALNLDVPVALAFVAFVIAGAGMGLAVPPQALVVLRESSVEEQGVATSALLLSDLLGTALGTGLAGAILAAGLRSGGGTGAALVPAFALGAAASAAGWVLSGRVRQRVANGQPVPA